MSRMWPRLVCVLVAVRLAAALQLPSCDEETESYCLTEGADLSALGIEGCLRGLAEGIRSERCTSYLALMAACEPDLSPDAVCGAAKMDGEAVPCLVQRTKPEDLTEACAAALPVEEKKGLAKFWADGKRQLTINEIADLNADDKDTYNRWMKKKKGKKTDAMKERDYAVKQAKKERVASLIATAVKEAQPADVDAAIAVAKKEMAQAVAEDMTGTLKAFPDLELKNIARDAYKAYKKSAKSEL